jgi:hypothetical protein
LVLPYFGGVLVCKSAARCTADAVSILRRDLFPATPTEMSNSEAQILNLSLASWGLRLLLALNGEVSGNIEDSS